MASTLANICAAIRGEPVLVATRFGEFQLRRPTVRDMLERADKQGAPQHEIAADLCRRHVIYESVVDWDTADGRLVLELVEHIIGLYQEAENPPLPQGNSPG